MIGLSELWGFRPNVPSQALPIHWKTCIMRIYYCVKWIQTCYFCTEEDFE